MSVDTVADFLTIIRNGLMVSKTNVVMPCSNLKLGIASILKDEGFICDFAIEEEDSKKNLRIYLKYINGESVIHELKMVSKQGRRVYKRIEKLGYVIGGLGIGILSTNRGIITDKQARALNVGGELICEVW